MHETPLDLLDAGMTANERQLRRARRSIERKLQRGKISAEDMEAAFRMAGEAFEKLADAMAQTAGIIVDSVGVMANRLKPMLDAVLSDNFEDLIRDLTDAERKTLRALREAAMQIDDPPPRKPKRGKGGRQHQPKFQPPPKSVRGKGRKQHHRRRR